MNSQRPEYEVLNDTNPTHDTVRRWGYDERLLLIDQDEDLVLGEVEYLPLLLEFAADPACPKKDYALGIVRQYCHFLIGCGRWDAVNQITPIAQKALTSTSAPVREWAEEFLRGVATRRI